MSFDVDVKTTVGEVVFSRNYTSNMGAFFAWSLQGVAAENPTERCDSRDAIFGSRPQDGLMLLNGFSTEAVAVKLRKALHRIDTADREWLKRFDAPNGWGCVETATKFLRDMLLACIDYPGLLVSVSM